MVAEKWSEVEKNGFQLELGGWMRWPREQDKKNIENKTDAENVGKHGELKVKKERKKKRKAAKK